MNKFTRGSILMAVIIAGTFSCGQDLQEPQEESAATQQKEIVFGDPSVYNIPYLAYRAAPPPDETFQWERAMSARNTVHFEREGNRPGSAHAAATGIYLTAHHVVYPAIYGHYVTSNVDMAPSTSGGGIYWYGAEQEDSYEHRGYFIGVNSACSHKTGAENKCAEEARYEEVGQTSQVYKTYFTPLTDLVVEHVERNRGLHGVPYRTSVADSPPAGSYEECVVNNPSDPSGCEEALAGFFPTDTKHVFRGCAGTGCPEGPPTAAPPDTEPTEPSEDPNVQPPLPEGTYWVVKQNEDTVYGVMGGRKSEGLGTIGIVFGPHAEVEWSMNWDFMQLRFRPTADGRLEHLVDNPQPTQSQRTRNLSKSLRQWYSDSTYGDYYTPLPMQLCPPKFAVHGLEVSEASDGSYVVGVTAVYCVRVDREPSDRECLDESNKETYPCKVPTYMEGTWGDAERSISQEIGNPDPASGNVRKMWCTEDELVSGLLVSESTTTVTERLSLSCQAYP